MLSELETDNSLDLSPKSTGLPWTTQLKKLNKIRRYIEGKLNGNYGDRIWIVVAYYTQCAKNRKHNSYKYVCTGNCFEVRVEA